MVCAPCSSVSLPASLQPGRESRPWGHLPAWRAEANPGIGCVRRRKCGEVRRSKRGTETGHGEIGGDLREARRSPIVQGFVNPPENFALYF